MDYTKDTQKLEVMAGKEKFVFEAYRNILHKGFNVNDEKRLDIESTVLHPRSAKHEKDILQALQDLRADQELLLEAGFESAYKLLHENFGKLAQTVFIKMMPGEGSNSRQKYLREVLSKHAAYDEFEEELYRELARRENKKDAGGFNQLNSDDPAAEKASSDAVNHDGEGGTERTEWDEELGWIKVLAPNAAKRPRSDETPPDSSPQRNRQGRRQEQGRRQAPRAWNLLAVRRN